MTFEDFIAKYPKCSIQSYEIAKAAWDEQQKKLEILFKEFEDDMCPEFEGCCEVTPFPRSRITFGPV
jgi:hypothetical protein